MSNVSKATDTSNDDDNDAERFGVYRPTVNTELIKAVENGDTDAAQLLIQSQTTDVNYVTEEDKKSLLGVACEKRHPDIVRMLLDKGAWTEVKNRAGCTPLYLAVVRRSPMSIVELLISHGADVGALGSGGQSCLIAAVSAGTSADIVQKLIDAGADVNWKRDDGLSALHLACQTGRTDLVETLLEQSNMELDASIAGGITPLYMAAGSGHSTIVKLLLDHGANVNTSTSTGQTCLIAAVDGGHTSVVEILLTGGAKVNGVCENRETQHGVSALGIACQKGHLNIARLLLENEAKIETKNCDGRTALYLAADNGHSGVVKLLLSNHADARACQNKAQSCLLAAVFCGSLEIVRSLLEVGADVNKAGDDGVCPLHVASQLGNMDIVVTLLDAGADHSVRTQNGSTALFLAVSCEQASVVDALISRHAKVNVFNNNHVTCLFAAVMRGSTPIVKRLLHAGAASDVNTPRADGVYPLHFAAQIDNAEIVEMLLKSGARIDTQTADGCTPLLQASVFGRVHVVRMLAGQGADCQKCNQAGDTCLISAAFEHRLEGSPAPHRHVETVRELIQLGADIDRQNRQGSTALSVASAKGNLEMVKVLVENGASVDLRNNYKDGYTALYWACQNAHLPIVKALINQHADVNVGVRSSCLLAAVMADNKEIAKEIAEILIHAGADVNFQRPADLVCPLAFVSSQGFHEIVKLLLDNKAHTELNDTEGRTPLWNAASRGHYKVVKLLLSANANVNACNEDDQSCLLIAAMSEKVDLHPLSKVEVTKVIRALLKAGANAKINSRGSDGFSPLAAAAQNGNLEVVILLLDNGATVDLQINSGCSPLWIAAERGHVSAVELLLNRDADINSLGSQKSRSSLLQAANNGHEELVGILLERGADANSFDIDMSSALLLAASRGHADTVMVLLEHGLDVNSRSYYETALTAAAGRGHIEVVNVLLKHGADLFARNNNNMTALETAWYGGHMKVMERLSYAEATTCVNEAKSQGELKFDLSQCNTALHETRDAEKARQLLANAADVDAENVEGLRPIHCAARIGLVEMVQLLIDHGANVDASDILGNRPLHDAVHCSRDVVELLVQRGARVNVQNIDGKTPLHVAVERQQSDVIKHLLDHNADVTITDVWRNTPLHYLTRVTATRDDIFSLLQPLITSNVRRFSQPNVVGVSVLQHLQTVCHYRIQHPRNLDLHSSDLWPEQLDEPVRDRFGNTALHYVVGVHAERKLTPISSNLCEDFMAYKGLDVDVQNTSEQTPLHVARGLKPLTVCVIKSTLRSFSICDRRRRNFWHLLRNRGVSVKTIMEMVKKVRPNALTEGTANTCTDDFGRTPLHYACMRGSSSLVTQLIEVSPQSIKVTDHMGRTPLHYTGLNGSQNKSIYAQLLNSKADETIQDKYQMTAKDYRRHRAQFDLDMNVITLFSSASYISQNFDRIVHCFEVCLKRGKGTQELRDILCELREGQTVGDYVEQLLRKSRFNYRNYLPVDSQHVEDMNSASNPPSSRGHEAASPETIFGVVRCRVNRIMKNLASEIEQLDERFKCGVVAVGSGSEGTRVGCFDEFDYMFVLTTLSDVLKFCEVRQSPESPAGFVQLVATSADQLASSQHNISELFNDDLVLATPVVNFIFESVVRKVLSAGQFQSDNKFELTDEEKMWGHSLTKINTEVSIRLTSQVEGHTVLHEISLDIVPAIHLPDWWPRPEHIRLQNVTAEVRQQGCNLVFTQPQVKYPWIGWTQPHAFISFAKAESELLRDSPAVVKDAFMVVKRMAKYMSHQVQYLSYPIKTAALYSLKDFKTRTKHADSGNYQEELVRLVKNMLRRLLCFAVQDYVESYFITDYIPPVWNFERQRKFTHTRLYQHRLTPQDLFAAPGPDGRSFYDREKNGMLTDSSLNAILKSVVCSHLMYWIVLSDEDQLILYFPDEHQRSPVCERSCWAKFSNLE